MSAGYTGANGNYYWGLLEPHDMAFALHFLRPDDLFIDAGANIGSYTLLASGAVGCRSIAFEPVPRTRSRLQENLNDNAIDSLADVRPMCLGAENGTVRFTVHLDTMNHVARDDEQNTIDLPVVRLDEEVRERPILIKIDTEGFDDNVLRGAERLLEGSDLMAVLIETLGSQAAGHSFAQTQAWLEAKGFRMMSYDLFSRRIIPAGASRMSNHLFIRGIEEAQERITRAPSFNLPGFGKI